ncbi:MAG: DNA polymerase III subunit gamma/tau [Candidatus Hydrogenedentota bacterium]|nr:MAG: DNA polymerase III subunit gamma/tau [Candidatus Hydrogenedentota bacterium]
MAKEKSDTYEGLARRYRPQTFDEVVGQGHIVRTLTKAIENGRWAHAYLFIGGRGLGKTTMARLLAKALNCKKGPTTTPCCRCDSCLEIAAGRDIDVLEIDAASNTGVDNVRDTIIQAVNTSAARARVKTFIVDEVHMLSTAAFNALLKTIEEPPSNVLFVLATTEGHKVPVTIRSRCQRFDFRPIPEETLVARLQTIAKKEKIKINKEALTLICRYAEGGVRDALSALDLVRSYNDKAITRKEVEEALGLVPHEEVQAIVEAISEGSADEVVSRVGSLVKSGIDPMEIVRGLVSSWRELLVASFERKGGMAEMSRGRIIRSLETLLETAARMRTSRFPRIELEVLLGRLCGLGLRDTSLRAIHEELKRLAAQTIPDDRNIILSGPPDDLEKQSRMKEQKFRGEKKAASADRLKGVSEEARLRRNEIRSFVQETSPLRNASSTPPPAPADSNSPKRRDAKKISGKRKAAREAVDPAAQEIATLFNADLISIEEN